MAFGALLGTLQRNVASVTNPTSTSAGSIAVNIGDLIFGVFGEQTSLTAGGTVTDNLGNTYAYVSAGTDAGTNTARAFYSRVTVAGTLTTVSIPATASANDAGIAVGVFEGPFATSPLDKAPTDVSNDLTTPYTGPATGTLAQADELVVSWFTTNGAVTHTATAPNTKSHQVSQGTTVTLSLGYQVVAATTTVTPAWTSSATPTADVIGTASFKKAASVPQTIPIGLVSSTHTATAMGRAKAKAIGISSETDTAFAVGKTKSKAVEQPSSTHTAFAMGKAKAKAIGLPSVTHTALPMGKAKSKAIGLATEVDTAPVLTRAKAKAIGLATSTHTAFPFTSVSSQIIAIGLAIDTSTALAFARAKAKAIGLAIENDSALPDSEIKTRLIGIAVDTSTALAMRPQRTKAIGLATEADIARPLAKIVKIGLAIENDSVFSFRHPMVKQIGIALETDHAIPFFVLTTQPMGQPALATVPRFIPIQEPELNLTSLAQVSRQLKEAIEQLQGFHNTAVNVYLQDPEPNIVMLAQVSRQMKEAVGLLQAQAFRSGRML